MSAHLCKFVQVWLNQDTLNIKFYLTRKIAKKTAKASIDAL